MSVSALIGVPELGQLFTNGFQLDYQTPILLGILIMIPQNRPKAWTLARLDAALTTAESKGPASPAETLVRIAVAYCDFAAANLELWRALFEHRMAPGKPVPEWAVSEQMDLFRHIYRPLAALFPDRPPAELGVTARSLFSAAHGMVLLGLEQKLIAVPVDALREEIAVIVRAMVDGLTAMRD